MTQREKICLCVTERESVCVCDRKRVYIYIMMSNHFNSDSTYVHYKNCKTKYNFYHFVC